jgi:hypothetical protein
MAAAVVVELTESAIVTRHRLHAAKLEAVPSWGEKCAYRMRPSAAPRLPPHPPLDVFHRAAPADLGDMFNVYVPDISNVYHTLTSMS